VPKAQRRGVGNLLLQKLKEHLSKTDETAESIEKTDADANGLGDSQMGRRDRDGRQLQKPCEDTSNRKPDQTAAASKENYAISLQLLVLDNNAPAMRWYWQLGFRVTNCFCRPLANTRVAYLQMTLGSEGTVRTADFFRDRVLGEIVWVFDSEGYPTPSVIKSYDKETGLHHLLRGPQTDPVPKNLQSGFSKGEILFDRALPDILQGIGRPEVDRQIDFLRDFDRQVRCSQESSQTAGHSGSTMPSLRVCFSAGPKSKKGKGVGLGSAVADAQGHKESGPGQSRLRKLPDKSPKSTSQSPSLASFHGSQPDTSANQQSCAATLVSHPPRVPVIGVPFAPHVPRRRWRCGALSQASALQSPCTQLHASRPVLLSSVDLEERLGDPEHMIQLKKLTSQLSKGLEQDGDVLWPDDELLDAGNSIHGKQVGGNCDWGCQPRKRDDGAPSLGLATPQASPVLLPVAAPDIIEMSDTSNVAESSRKPAKRLRLSENREL